MEYLVRAATGSAEALTSATALRLGDGLGALGASGASTVRGTARKHGRFRREQAGVGGSGGAERKREAASIGTDEASIAAPRHVLSVAVSIPRLRR
jgi:hypothetical protein